MDLPEHIGRYEVISLLGQGGMGRVVLAKDSVLGRKVAIKTLRDDLGLPPELKERLTERMRNEAKAAATLSHPNMVTLHDMGEDPTVGLFLVFEYVEGPTLRERIADGPMTPMEVARLARELGGALSHAHSAGVIHRDVKPENVILSKTGGKITDFGIARIPDSTLTTAGATMGTPAYSAPEALAKGEFSASSDQFSLAALLYEMLSGKRAFAGEDALSTATMVATMNPPLLSENEAEPSRRLVLRRIDGVLSRALAKDKGDRYTTCEAFGDALAAAIDTRSSGAFSTFPPGHTQSMVPRATRRWQNLVAGVGLLVIVGLIVLGRRNDETVSKTNDDPKPSASPAASPSKPPAVVTSPKPKPKPVVSASTANVQDAALPDAAPTVQIPQPL
jgi:eukaryotic-like serine/threonine-protein kinase